MSDDGAREPTIEAVLERINKLEERLGVRPDRIEGLASQTGTEMLAMRADFTE